MKQLDAMSFDYCADICKCETEQYGCIAQIVQEAYEAGFRKARELAVDYMEAKGENYYGLDNLGEHEVEE